MITQTKRWSFWRVVSWIIAVLFVLFLIYPLATLFLSSFKDTDTGAWTLANYARFFSRGYYMGALFNSFKLTLSVTILAILIGVPLAYAMSFFRIRGKGILEIIFIISMMSPNFIGAYSWVLLLGRSGVITTFMRTTFGIQMPSIYGFGGMLLVFTLKLYPFIYMYVSGAFKKIDATLIEAAENLGAGPLKKVSSIVMPLITPTLVAAGLLVFMNSMADFGTPALIGEGYQVMPTLVYSEFVGETGGSAYFAAAMAAIMVGITAILFIMQKWYVNSKSFTMSSVHPVRPKRLQGGRNVLTHAVLYALAALSILPQLVVIYTSFRKTHLQVFVPGFSLDSYKTIFDTALSSILNTYLYCAAAILLIVVIGMLIAYLSVRKKNWLTNLLDTVAMFPYIVPGSVMGITLLLAFNRPPIMLAGSAAILVLSLTIRRLAYTLRSSSAILYQISGSVEEAAISLGDSPFAAFRKVTARLMLPGVISGAILSWITLINELSSSVMLYTARTRTISVAIYNEVIRASYGTAAALASILTITTVVSLLIFFKVSGQKDVAM